MPSDSGPTIPIEQGHQQGIHMGNSTESSTGKRSMEFFVVSPGGYTFRYIFTGSAVICSIFTRAGGVVLSVAAGYHSFIRIRAPFTRNRSKARRYFDGRPGCICHLESVLL